MANWIFQGNPKKFNIDKENFPNIHDLNSYIEKDKTIKWSVRQAHLVEDIKKGDQVFIWRSDGGETNTGGAVALAEIVTEPFKSKNIFPEVELLVKEYRLTEQEGMLMRHKLKELPETKNLLILRAPAQTNYKLSDEEFNILNKYWNTPEKLNETDKLSLVDKYLYYYQAEFEQFQIEFDFLRESYNFFSTIP